MSQDTFEGSTPRESIRMSSEKEPSKLAIACPRCGSDALTRKNRLFARCCNCSLPITVQGIEVPSMWRFPLSEFDKIAWPKAVLRTCACGRTIHPGDPCKLRWIEGEGPRYFCNECLLGEKKGE